MRKTARTPGKNISAPDLPLEPVADADRSIRERLPQLVESLINLAVGIKVERETSDKLQVYTQPPNRLAAEYLINRVLGRPAEKVQSIAKDTVEEDYLDLKDLREMSTNELIQLHRETIGED